MPLIFFSIIQEVRREHLHKDVSVRHVHMKVTKVDDSLRWGRREAADMHNKDADLEKLAEEQKPLTPNQIAAKRIQLQLRGNHGKSEKLLVRYHI